MPSRRLFAATAATAIWLTAAAPTHAQTARTGGGAGSQLQMQVQQLAAEKTRLDADNAKLKKELEDAHKELDALKNAQKTVDQRAKESAAALAQNKAQSDSTEAQLKQTKDKMEQLIAKFREVAQSLRDTEADRTAVKQSLSARDQQLHVCVDHNAALYQLNDEVLTYLDKQGFWSHVAASEPFTKIKRIRNENLADDYKARAEDQRVAPPQAPATAAPPQAPAPAPATH
jgi:chromosome segregation ATPase